MAFPDPLKYHFPHWLEHEDSIYYASDIVSIGDPLTSDNLIEAYRKGIFPWHMDHMPLPWFCPDPRAILEFKDLNIPASLKRARNKRSFSFSINKAFRRVIKECSQAKREGQKGTWITPEFIEAYSDLHALGHAHSVEAWDETGNLVGGIYGVDAGGVFCGESMFYKRPNASKLALLFLIDHLAGRGSTWMDIQVMTPHMKMLGAIEVPRREFLKRLAMTQHSKGIFS